MKTIVAVLVHDRLENIKQWLNCWQQCEQHGAELIVIQNDCGNTDIEAYCAANKVKYIPRKNVGFDIGAFQDVCQERLKGFDNDWDTLLWCTDDTFPMRKDFLAPYLKLLPDNGVVCTDLSRYVKTHIRTTGFAIGKKAASQIKFEKDPIETKSDCYQFEHLSKKAFYEQIIKMGLKVTQAEAREKSPMWDSGYKRRLPRERELKRVFPIRSDGPRLTGLGVDAAPMPLSDGDSQAKIPKVAFICPAYNSYPQIISSLINQTHKNWELFLLHDGPNSSGMQDHVMDSRIHYTETPERAGKWGHSLRQWGLQNIDRLCPDADYIVITNADNYHVPVYIEYLLHGFSKNTTAVAAYCSDMVHSYKAWQVIPCRLQLGYIDCAGVMIKKNVACEVGWRDIENHSSDWIYFSDIIKKYGADKWQKVLGCLLVHN